jgi:hypothetical protein
MRGRIPAGLCQVTAQVLNVDVIYRERVYGLMVGSFDGAVMGDLDQAGCGRG